MEEVPFEDRHVPRAEIDWERSAWWWYPLTRAIHPALRMNALVVALIAILLAVAGVRLGLRVFDAAWEPVWVHPSPTAGFRLHVLDWATALLQSLFSFQQFGLRELAFSTFALLWLTLVFALLGGVLARRSLVELGERTVAAWGESCRIVFSRWHSFLWSTGMHLVGLLLLLIPILILGAVSRLGSGGAHIGGVLLLLMFPLVFAVGRFALGAIVCFPLSVCAIAAERKADAFEGFSRSYAYFFQRPVLACLCALILVIVGAVGEQLVYWIVTLGWSLMGGAYRLSGGAELSASTKYLAAGDWLAAALIAAYWFSYFWSASAAVYLILRKSVDSTELYELDHRQSPHEQTLPEIPPPPAT